ncbi:hypothetical protein KI387_034442 [Taxus chinensis]|uniref:ABC transporter domain-containing protein n=1 Tax=Taxus chinensis TaxID=29808 RepID=A0AA38BUZ5_TAXCH|nr:hypothetical protein KI387_034442 [Taxus chinensis]
MEAGGTDTEIGAISRRTQGGFSMSWGSANDAAVFSRSSSLSREADEEDLKLAALNNLLKTAAHHEEDDDRHLLYKMRSRIHRVGIELPTVEVRFERLKVEVGRSRWKQGSAHHTQLSVKHGGGSIHVLGNKKRRLKILDNINGNIKPRRMTLLLGPPGSGKTSLLLALANRLDTDLKVSGSVTYNGENVDKLVAERISAYVAQNDIHFGEMTVRETFSFAARCQGFGSRNEMLTELERREKEAGIIPEQNVDTFMKVRLPLDRTIVALFQDPDFKSDYVVKSLGLDMCSDMMVGDEMRRGISGGQKKRVTTGEKMPSKLHPDCAGEILVGSAMVLLMDEITTGLDSSTSFQIVKHLRQLVQTLDITALVSLLQPTPETFELFDDIILLSEGHIVYQGPLKHALEFFESMGFRCPERKAVADFFQEVTSKKDQQQYWAVEGQVYRYVSVKEFAKAYQSFHVGKKLSMELRLPYDKSKSHPASVTAKLFRQFLLYFLVNQLALALFRLMASLGQTMVVAFTYGAFSMVIILVLGGFILSRESIKSWWIWGYWISPLSYAQNAIAVNEFYGQKWDKPAGNVSNQTVGELGLRSRGIFPHEWWYWIGIGALLGYAILFNVLYTLALDFLKAPGKPQSVVSEEALHEIYANTIGENCYANNAPTAVIVRDDLPTSKGPTMNPILFSDVVVALPKEKKGMVLPFKTLSLCFKNIKYYVDMPKEMKQQGIAENRLQLLHNVSGAFRPGILTALVGVSGAGKTTLMDVLAGRKTDGYIEGTITISGHPKKQETFARISGYCEQNDIHSPHVTVHESLIYSAWLRLPAEIDQETRKMFVEEVMKLVELDTLRNSLVGPPGVTGLSTEQRKRLTIAVELVANPSIVFMDEPTSGLDARSAAIVMRTVRNIVDTGRTIVCTIHQPSIDIFEAFDELFFMKRGGQIIYAGSLGFHCNKLLEYFQSIDGVPKIEESCNPATWMLEVTSTAEEIRLGIDFAEIYRNSHLFQENMALVESFSTPLQGSEDLYFTTQYSQPFHKQFMACLWKQHWSYWRNPQYTAVRFFFTVSISLLFGTICWDLGSKRSEQQDLLNILGSMFASILFIGVTNATSVQPVVSLERVVFYRERAAGMYSALPYALAQVAIELPYVLIQSLVYGSVVYSLTALEWTAVKFVWYLFFMYFGFLSYTFFGIMTVALTPNHNLASIVSIPFFLLWNLFSGFMIPLTRCPPWWKWYFRANPMAWSLYGLIASQYGDVRTGLKMPDGTELSVKDYVEEYFGYHEDYLGRVGLVMAGFCILFGFVFALGIKFFNFQKR